MQKENQRRNGANPSLHGRAGKCVTVTECAELRIYRKEAASHIIIFERRTHHVLLGRALLHMSSVAAADVALTMAVAMTMGSKAHHVPVT